MKTAMITRTFVKSTVNYTRFSFAGGELVPLDYGTAVFDFSVDAEKAEKLIRKKLKTELIRIDEINTEEQLYGCTVEDFLSVAHPIEK